MSNPTTIYLQSLTTPTGQAAQRSALRAIAQFLGVESETAIPWATLSHEDVQRIRSHFAAEYSPSTANRYMAAVRSCLKVAWRLRQIDTDQYYRLIDVKSIKGSRLPAGRSLSQDELDRLIAVCKADTSPAGIRDTAIFHALRFGGLRRDEIVRLELANFTGDTLRVVGKSNDEREVPIEGDTVAAIEAWLRLRSNDPGYLFTAIVKGGKVTTSGMSDVALHKIAMKRSRQAKIERFSLHDIRRTFAGDLIDLGVDVVTVSGLMGHRNVKTTAAYDRRPARTRRAAIAKLMGVSHAEH